jgi:DNA-binding LacI/PurR family transcriptional regulator
MPRRTATLEDVARAAGVSQQTVSRVLNRPEVVSARTREQVIRAMQALHYVPNRSAQLLAGKAAPSIGLITASLTLHAPSQIAAAVKSHASLHQLEVAIAMPAQADFAALQARLDELRAQHIRGVIVSLPLESATAERLVKENPDMACLFLDVSRRPMSAACASIIATAAGPACAICGSWGIANLACWQGRKVRFPPVCVSPAGARRCTV